MTPPDYRETSLAFLKLELTTAMSFAELARQAGHDDEKRERNRWYAKQAHQNIVRLITQLELTAAEAGEISEGLKRLETVLEEIPQ